MPNDITDADLFTTTCESQADGEAANSTNELLSHQDLADRTRWLYNRSIEAKGGVYQIPLVPSMLMLGGWTQRFAWDNANNGLVQFSALVGSTDRIHIPLPALIDCSFSNVILTVDGDANGVGPHGALPTLPTVYLYKLNAAAGTWSLVGSQTDTSASVAAYEVLHTITYTPGPPQVMDADTQYQIQIEGESGATSINNALVIFGAKMTVVPT